MHISVGDLNNKEVLETYKSFFEKEISFDCEVVIYGHSIEDYELARSICLGTTEYTYPILFENKHLFMILNELPFFNVPRKTLPIPIRPT